MSKIKFDEDLLLENITRFMQYATLKNSKEVEEYETPASRLFGEYLLKYYDEELNDDDLLGLFNLIAVYNEAVDKDENKEIAFYNFLKNDYLNGGHEKGKSIVEQLLSLYSSTVRENLYKESLNIFSNNTPVFSKEFDDSENKISDVLKVTKETESVDIINSENELNKLISESNSELKNDSQLYNIYITFSNSNDINIKNNNIIKNINKYLNSLKIKFRVYELTVTGNNYKYKNEKRTANFDEKYLTGKNEAYALFNLVLDCNTGGTVDKLTNNNNINNSKLIKLSYNPLTNKKIENPVTSLLGLNLFNGYTINSTNDKEPKFLCISILYKELNPKYREIEKSNAKEMLMEAYIDGKDAEEDDKLFISSSSIKTDNSVFFNLSAFDDIKNLTLENELFFGSEELKSTKFWYANPYNARKGEESSLISYYINSPVFNKSSDSTVFGALENERNNIYNFIDIYDETRYYFYKALLNESFISEPDYNIFEKLYLTAYSIDRFLTKKVELGKDISTFTRRDFINFFETFGLKSLSDKIQKSSFSNDLDDMKIVAANYADFMSSKGSRAVINKIIKSFTQGDTTLDIRKYYLIKKIEGETYKYGFIESEYLPENVTRNINENLRSFEPYETFVSDDRYWVEKDVELLDDLNITTIETKYLTLDLKKNIYRNYILYNYLMSAMEILVKFDKFDRELGLDNLKKKSDNGQLSTTEPKLSELVQEIRHEMQMLNKRTSDHIPRLLTLDDDALKDKDNTSRKIISGKIADFFSFLGLPVNAFGGYVSVTTDSVLESPHLTLKPDINSKLENIIGKDNGGFINPLKDYLIALIYIYGILNNSSILTDLNSGTLDFALNSILAFPMAFFDGSLGKYTQEKTVFSYNIHQIINKLLDIYSQYSTDEYESAGITITKDFTYLDQTTLQVNTSDYYDEHSKILVALGGCLSDVFTDNSNVVIKVMNAEDIGSELEFIKILVNEFISYTAMLHSSSASYEYKTTGERVLCSDRITFAMNMNYNDLMYYDDELKIKKVGGNS